MTIEELDLAFHPRSIAVVGISNGTISIGRNFIQQLKEYGYRGNIYPVTKNRVEVVGLKAYATIKDIPGQVDYVICCLPASEIMDLLRECSDKDVRVVHLFTARFSETGKKEATELENEILRLAKKLSIRIIGPNCMGVYHPKQGLGFAFDFPKEPGKLGMFLQSGGAASEFVYYAALRGIRISKMMSYGNALDINETDILEYLANDKDTEIIAGYVEGIRDGRAFVRQLSQTTPSKPVVILKAGRGSAGAEAAASHTAAMAGSEQAWTAAFKQSGVIEARTLQDMIDLIVAFYFLPPILGTRVGIAGGGGGNSVLSAGEWGEAGFDVAPLPQDTEEMIREIMPELWWGWIRNPVDLSILPINESSPNLSGDILKMMAKSDAFDFVVANFAIGGPFSKEQLNLYLKRQVEDVIEARQMGTKPVVAVIDTGHLTPNEFDDLRWKSLAEVTPRLIDAGIPIFSNNDWAASSLMSLIQHHRRREAIFSA
ncbi:MAG: CoA-binding protein [Desulfatiglans sp.]|jgi:acetyltransferase|nr:CoA-binding protein [Desulfatiglans sp.]